MFHPVLGGRGRGQVVGPSSPGGEQPEDDGRGGIQVPGHGLDHSLGAGMQGLIRRHDGEHHADDEPVTRRRQRAQPADARGKPVEGDDDPEGPRRQGHSRERQQVGASTPALDASRDHPGEKGKCDIEHRLRRQAPQLGQAGQVPLVAQRLHLQQVGHPRTLGRGAGLRDERERTQEDQQPGGHQPGGSPDGIRPEGRRRQVPEDGAGVRSIEEEATEHEEDRHPDVHPGQEAGQDVAADRAGQEPGVGEEDGEGCRGPQTLEFDQMTRARPRGVRCLRLRGRRAHRVAPRRSTWTDVRQTPWLLGVTTSTRTVATLVPYGTRA